MITENEYQSTKKMIEEKYKALNNAIQAIVDSGALDHERASMLMSNSDLARDIKSLNKTIEDYEAQIEYEMVTEAKEDFESTLEHSNQIQNTQEQIPLGVLITDKTISLILGGKPFVINIDHPNFFQIKSNLKNKDYTNLKSLIDQTEKIHAAISNISFENTQIEIVDNQVLYQGYPINNVLGDKLVEEVNNGHDVGGFVRFIDNLMQNPSRNAVQELYLFIEHANLPITDDGCFLAYKKVRSDYLDIYSGKFDNSPGQKHKMPRNLVDENRENTCSDGFHFCSYEYLPHFGRGPGNRVVILKINPRDVVTIPKDYDNTKGRVCRYEVISEVEDWGEDVFEGAHGSQWDSSDEEEPEENSNDSFEEPVSVI